MIPTQPSYPVWPKVVAAFVAGMLFAAFSITQVTPGDRIQSVNSTGGDGATASEFAASPDESFVDAEGNVVSADEVFVNEQGQTVDKQGRVLTKTGGGSSGAGGSTGSAGSAGKAGTAGTKGGASKAAGGVAGGQLGTAGGNSGSGGTECKAGKNGGVTDEHGVTATEIKVAATVVKDGHGASLLKASETGMRAVLNKVNNSGGVCGRRINLTTVNDSWDRDRGAEYIQKFIEQKYFALPVVPSSEGLSVAISSGRIKGAGIPVVGTNGLRVDQYHDPWVFPVGAATVSIMRSMAKYASDKGAKTFGVVYDQKYRFGLEGAEAFRDYVEGTLHKEVKAFQPLDPDKLSYGTEANEFNGKCGGGACDVVVLLLVPSTALNWRAANPGGTAGRGVKTYGAQTLFTDDFAGQCGGWCNGMLMWTGYNPPIPPLDSKAGVQEYVNDVKALDPGIDTRNQFTQGAYLGMKVFVKAVQDCSPNLNRACVQQKLDAMSYGSDLASTLIWKPGSDFAARAANKTAQAFKVDANGGSFNNWQFETTFVADPDPK